MRRNKTQQIFLEIIIGFAKDNIRYKTEMYLQKVVITFEVAGAK